MSNICTNYGSIVNTSIGLMFHVSALFLILGLFFMLYASSVMRDVFASELDHIIKKDLKKTLNDMDAISEISLKSTIEVVDLDRLIKLYSTEDEAFAVHNEWLFNVIIIITVSLFIVTIIAIVISKLLCNDINLTHLIVENILIFTGIGLIEMMFFFFVAQKYIPAPPSAMINSIVKSLDKNL